MRESRLSVPVHYCSSRFKDGVQLRQRLLRRAERTAPAFADRTTDGTVVLGIIESTGRGDFSRWASRVARTVHLEAGSYRLDPARRRLELAPEVLRRAARRLPWPAFEIEVYPTEDALEVERNPLNESALVRTGADVGST